MQNEHATVSGLIAFDDDNNICNKLLKDVAPHKSDKGGTNIIKKCGRIRLDTTL